MKNRGHCSPKSCQPVFVLVYYLLHSVLKAVFEVQFNSQLLSKFLQHKLQFKKEQDVTIDDNYFVSIAL